MATLVKRTVKNSSVVAGNRSTDGMITYTNVPKASVSMPFQEHVSGKSAKADMKAKARSMVRKAGTSKKKAKK